MLPVWNTLNASGNTELNISKNNARPLVVGGLHKTLSSEKPNNARSLVVGEKRIQNAGKKFAMQLTNGIANDTLTGKPSTAPYTSMDLPLRSTRVSKLVSLMGRVMRVETWDQLKLTTATMLNSFVGYYVTRATRRSEWYEMTKLDCSDSLNTLGVTR